MLRAVSVFGLGACLVACTTSAAALPFNRNNVLLSFNNQIYEYTTTGTVVQTIPIPWPNGSRPVSETTRDLVVLNDGRVAVYNGTFDPYLSIFNPALNTWQHSTYPGWSTGNNARFAGIAASGPYVFVSDSRTFGDGGLDEARGTIRFDTRDMSAQRFETLYGTRDVTIGLDGLLYSIGDDNDPTERIRVFDPASLAVLRTITLDPGGNPNGIAVDASGQIFGTGSNSQISVFSPNGSLIRTGSVGGGAFINDIDVAPNGMLIGGTVGGPAWLGDTSLSSFTFLPSVGSSSYVSFAYPIPEPCSAAFLSLIPLCAALRRRA